jgi:hypothetical protein
MAQKLIHPVTGQRLFASSATAQRLLDEWHGALPAADAAAPAERPSSVQRPRAEWDAYARAIGLDPTEFRGKQQLIDAIDHGRTE